MNQKNIILDIDGTIIDNNRPVNKSLEFMKILQKNSIEYIFATNSIRSHEVQVKRLKDLGFEASIDSIYSPIDSINTYIKLHKISRAFLIGSSEDINQVDVNISKDNPELIILLDFRKENTSYNELQYIVDFAITGIPLISASGSTSYHSQGKTIIDTGAFVKLIESITETTIPILGKPSREYFRNAEMRFENKKETWMFGDDIQTDIMGGIDAGLHTALIKSGKYKPGDEKLFSPHRLLSDLMEF
ncbi:MAG: HAD-IIA family hydrolase [Spirochaetaceae bacterium]|jgi:HAD superfamily hydrolase (TIGR01450 family)|nr:HAD-IIA family hydrolase [Spirochaetaceae bacterium]